VPAIAKLLCYIVDCCLQVEPILGHPPPGMACSVLGAASVMLTDQEPVVEMVAESADQNLTPAQRANVHTAPLFW
jgi:hypothetical protein